MNLIAAVDRNWAIGKDNQLLVSIPADQKLFREETMGKVLIMGRKTLESLPGARPLAGRTTFVLSSNQSYQVKGARVCHTVDEMIQNLDGYEREDIFVAGGGSVYAQLLPYCQVAHITYIDYKYEADCFAPNLDQDPSWKLVMSSEEQTYFDLCYEYRMYIRIKEN